ncbi:MAG: GT4 family glycosyltransferase PelF [Deltaproteobacteria bacterium]|nr:GT4 family glycosyltransferase PelF [Deltaproteobacteria bacterium]
MKNLRFGILFIASHSDPTRELRYEIPQNVLYLKEVPLHDYYLERRHQRRPRKKDFENIRLFYEGLEQHQHRLFPEILDLFHGERSCFDTQNFFSSMKIWDLLTYFYKRYVDDISFLDFFWTWRGTHLPLLQILQTELPRAKIYHSISTGYAGLLAAIGKARHGGRLFLTEHGIYTHERFLEISQAQWLYEKERRQFRPERELSFFKRWWVRMFQVMSQITYHEADRIFTLYEGNKVNQVLEGASADKISIIPNGIDLKSYDGIDRFQKEEPQIGFVGRVVAIKDVKTFIQAARQIASVRPKAHFYIIGPKDEEEEYYEECQVMVESFHLEEKVTFTGQVNVKDYYRFIDLVVLTSLSEAQPYVIMEANLAGIPVVASDVGACREMLEGRDASDRAIGPSGLVTEVSNPGATAKAVLSLLEDRGLYQRMGRSGQERVRRFYDQDDLLSRYLNLYEQNL